MVLGSGYQEVGKHEVGRAIIVAKARHWNREKMERERYMGSMIQISAWTGPMS